MRKATKKVRQCIYFFLLFFLLVPGGKKSGSGSWIPDPPTLMFAVLRILDVYPGSWFLPILDPGSKNSNKREGWKKIWCHTFLFSHKFHEVVHYFSFEVLKKKIWANFQRIVELLAQKIVTKLSKVWVWDPGCGKNLFRIPDPGVKKAPDPGSGSATLDVLWGMMMHVRTL